MGNPKCAFRYFLQLAYMKLEKQGFLLDRADKLLFCQTCSHIFNGEICSEIPFLVSQMLDFSE